MDSVEKQGLLAHSTLPTFRRKVAKALKLIEEALAIAPAYVSVSWGKDSVAMLHLCQQIQPNIPAINFYHPERDLIGNFSEVEEKYCQCWATKLIAINIKGDHVPAKVQKAKLWLKYPVSFVGLRADESKNRAITLEQNTLIHKYKNKDSWRCCPIGFWKEIDVWAYTISRNLPYLNLYDKGATRTTDHVSKKMATALQCQRLEEFKLLCPEYYWYLKQNFGDIFYG